MSCQQRRHSLHILVTISVFVFRSFISELITAHLNFVFFFFLIQFFSEHSNIANAHSYKHMYIYEHNLVMLRIELKMYFALRCAAIFKSIANSLNIF